VLSPMRLGLVGTGTSARSGDQGRAVGVAEGWYQSFAVEDHGGAAVQVRIHSWRGSPVRDNRWYRDAPTPLRRERAGTVDQG